MFEVAKLAGVSHQTVSRVVNDSPDVSETTRTKVREAITKLGYRPSNSARSLASQRSHTIGLIAGGLRFYGPISAISAIESVARSHGLFLSVSLVHDATCTQEEFERLCETFDEQNVDAFVLLTPTDVMFRAACRTSFDQPRVMLTSTHGKLSMREAGRLERPDDRRHTALVGIDQWSAMHEVARLVASYGHRSALYFAGPQDWRDAVTRALAWSRAAQALSIVSQTVQCESWESSEAYGRMNHILERFGSSGSRRPTVVVTANDAQAVGVVRALHEHRLNVPRDISVVGFDDMPAMNDLYPPLTTVRPDFEQMGTAAMREVLRLLGEGEETAFAASAHGVGLIPARVIKRASLGRVPVF
jgi:DNA-binding LacI/PurR family transcriptional regulator